MEDINKAESVRVGQMVSWNSSGGRAEGKVRRVLRSGSYKVPNSDFTISGTEDSPAAVIELYRDGKPTKIIVGHKVETLSVKKSVYSEAYERGYEGCGCQECIAEDIPCEICDTCNPSYPPTSENSVRKAESYSPNSGMRAAAKRSLKWKEEGKATGAGTPVGWGRATDIVAGRSMSLSVVKRMYSFFARHEVDKKGKNFYDTSNPSNGRIMWDAWGGDAGFSWSRKIVKQNQVNKFWQESPFFN